MLKSVIISDIYLLGQLTAIFCTITAKFTAHRLDLVISFLHQYAINNLQLLKETITGYTEKILTFFVL